MGGEPKLALNLFCITKDMPEDMIKEILRGGFDKVYEAGAIVCGGHTIYDDSPKYGLAVNGFVHPKKILENSTAKEGDVLILTKPIGTGILLTASKADMSPPEELDRCYKIMAFLNAKARNIMVKYKINACTDITGFGLLGHLYEMGKGSGMSIEVDYKSVPIYKSVIESAEMGMMPAGVYSNRNFVGDNIVFENVPLAYQDLMFDPQTSGGLLISVDKEDAAALYEELSQALENTPCGKPAIIGLVTKREEKILMVS